MPILVVCECGDKFNAKDEMAGRKAKCPSCGQILLIKAANSPAQPKPPSQGSTVRKGGTNPAVKPGAPKSTAPNATAGESSLDELLRLASAAPAMSNPGFGNQQSPFGNQPGMPQGGSPAAGGPGLGAPMGLGLGGPAPMGAGQFAQGQFGQGQFGQGQYGQAFAQPASSSGGSSKTLWIIGGVGSAVVLLVIVGLVVLSLRNRGSNVPASVAQSDPSTSPNNTPTGETPATGGNTNPTVGGWTKFTSKRDQYTVEFPGRPKETRENVGLTSSRVASYETARKELGCLVSVTDSVAIDLSGAPPEALEAMFGAAVSAMQKKLNATVVNDQPHTVGNYPGREVEMTGQQNGQDSRMRLRLLLAFNRLYIVAYMAFSERYVAEDAERFLTSFKLEEGGSSAPALPSKWVTFVQPKYQFSINFPEKPSETTTTVNDQEQHTVSSAWQGTTFSVISMNTPQGEDPLDWLKRDFEGLVQTMSGKTEKQGEVSEEDLKGWEVVFTSDMGDGPKFIHARGWIGSKGRRLFRLYVVGSVASKSEALITEYFKSFKHPPSSSSSSPVASNPSGKPLHVGILAWEGKIGPETKGVYPLKPDDSPPYSLSWMTHVLPYLGHEDIHARIDFKKDIDANVDVAREVIPEFLDPAQPTQRWYGHHFPLLGLTHFVGMSGIEDKRTDIAAVYPRSDPRAGMFGYKQIARPSEVTDGASQTIALIGSGKLTGPWALGGGSTIRGARLSGSPPSYFDDLRGFGSAGASPRGAYALMVDGSCKVISAQVNSKVFRSLCTIHGKETVDKAGWETTLSNFPPATVKTKVVKVGE